VTVTHYRINHLLCTGQSLSIGSKGEPPLSTRQPYDNVMFNTGVRAGGSGLLAFVPLVEHERETMSSGLANLVTRMARQDLFAGQPPPDDTHDLLVSCHGVGGQAYVNLRKRTTPYENGLNQVRAAQAISRAMGLSHVVRGVTVVHGERDHVEGNTHYREDLVEWQADYERDVTAITGQSEPIPMFQSQMSSWTQKGDKTSLIPGAQLRASTQNPDTIFLVGPKYFLDYADGLHLTNHSYRRLGEYYAKVYRKVVLEGNPWRPVSPSAVSRSGKTITVTFHVPAPPLVLDTEAVTDPGHYGFEYWDDSGAPPEIASVTVVAPDQVQIVLTQEPSTAATKLRVRYAFTGDVSAGPAPAGPHTGPRGNLRDSDATVSRHGYALHNWCVHFNQAVP
jgi:hypothetical protein